MLERAHPPFELQHLHVQGGLLPPERGDLLLEACVLLLLMSEMPLDVFLDFEQLVCQRFSHVLRLQGQRLLKDALVLAKG